MAESYIICTSPRSGSTLLSEMLACAGDAGGPIEFLNRGYRDGHTDWTTYLELVRRSCSSDNGVFGGKAHWYQLDEYICDWANIDSGDLFDALCSSLGVHRFIWLRRADVLRQAISLYRAMISSTWWLPTPSTLSRPRPLPYKPAVALRQVVDAFHCGPAREVEYPFDFEAISHIARVLEEQDLRWSEFFRDRAILPIELEYEALVSFPAATIGKLRRQLDLPEKRAEDDLTPPLHRQADGMTDELVHRFISERRRRTQATSGT
ncbi:MAG: hypothetical protein E7812_00320 [Phenylobacterium sp.]|nr:MAG: hypothetical protein E7812_00320 [Phenylobacterium sp.]